MVLLKGDKIKQVKGMLGFDFVGKEFEIVNVDVESNSISFSCGMGVSIMSYDECEKYFEKVVNDKDKDKDDECADKDREETNSTIMKEEWSEWKNLSDSFYGFGIYRTKGELIECAFPLPFEKTCISTFAKPCETDKYDLETGIEVCIKKYEIKKAKALVKDIEKEIRELQSEIKKAKNEKLRIMNKIESLKEELSKF